MQNKMTLFCFTTTCSVGGTCRLHLQGDNEVHVDGMLWMKEVRQITQETCQDYGESEVRKGRRGQIVCCFGKDLFAELTAHQPCIPLT